MISASLIGCKKDNESAPSKANLNVRYEFSSELTGKFTISYLDFEDNFNGDVYDISNNVREISFTGKSWEKEAVIPKKVGLASFLIMYDGTENDYSSGFKTKVTLKIYVNGKLEKSQNLTLSGADPLIQMSYGSQL